MRKSLLDLKSTIFFAITKDLKKGRFHNNDFPMLLRDRDRKKSAVSVEAKSNAKTISRGEDRDQANRERERERDI